MNNIDEVFYFHNAVTSVSQGNILNVGRRTTLVIETYGTAISKNIQFFAKNLNGDSIPINGFNETTVALATSTNSTTAEVWSFDITGKYQIYMNVSSIIGGNVTIVGRIVSN